MSSVRLLLSRNEPNPWAAVDLRLDHGGLTRNGGVGQGRCPAGRWWPFLPCSERTSTLAAPWMCRQDEITLVNIGC